MAQTMDQVLVQKVIHQLKKRGLTLALAESCTGGLVSSSLVENSGVSSVFQGSVVSYSNDSKVQLLGVSTQTLKDKGAVSEEAALEMAQGVCSRLSADWAVSVTGVAGPEGGTKEKPVGTVCFALVGPGVEETRKEFFSGQRCEVRQQSAQMVFKLLYEGMS